MFDQIARQLQIQSLGKGDKDFKITKQEFEDFCKYYLFEQIKDGKSLGRAFCSKYSTVNYVLETLPDASAKRHIETFYVK
jgi:hypothetical protein